MTRSNIIIHNLNCSCQNRPPKKSIRWMQPKNEGDSKNKPQATPNRSTGTIIHDDKAGSLLFGQLYRPKKKTLVLLSKIISGYWCHPLNSAFECAFTCIHHVITSDLSKQNLPASNRPTVHQSITEPVPVIKSPKTSIQFPEDSMQLRLGIWTYEIL